MNERFKQFTFLVARLNTGIQKIKTAEMSEFNLKGPQVSSVYYLYNLGKATVKQLREISGEDKASIARAVASLEELGYVVCLSNAPKRYNAEYALTDKGKELGVRLSSKIDKIIDIMGKGVSPENRIIMYSALELIAHNIDDYFLEND